jgi:hypothetical protein
MLKNMTVPNLKALAKDMNVPINSKMRKDDLIAVIKVQIELDHVKALEDDSFLSEELVVEFDVPTVFAPKKSDFRELTDKVLEFHFKALHRFNPSEKKDKRGNVIVTAAQRRRLHKKVNSYAKKIGFFSYGV